MTAGMYAKSASSIAVLLLFFAAARPAGAQLDGSASGAFLVRGRVAVTACADHCATQLRRIREQVTVQGDVFTSTSLLGTCGDVSAQDVAGLATFVPERHGWLKMRLLDRKRFVALVGACAGNSSLRLGRIRYEVRPTGDTAFDGRLALGGALVVRGRRVSFVASGRFHVSQVFTQRTPAPAPRAAGMLATTVGGLFDD